MKKVKIAVLLHGLLRSWKQCSTVFSYWNSIYPDVEFDFYLATWDESFAVPKGKGERENFNDNTFLNLKDVSFHKEEEMYKGLPHYLARHFKTYKDSDGWDLSIFPYSFLRSKVCDLVKKSNIEYDACILSRTDIFVYKEFLDLVRVSGKYKTHNDFMKSTENQDYFELGPEIIYNPDGVRWVSGRYFCSQDFIWYGSQEVILKNINFYKDIFIDCKLPPVSIHVTSVRWAMVNNIFIRSIPTWPSSNIVRGYGLGPYKDGYPSAERLDRVIESVGKGIYQLNAPTIVKEYFRD